jgi:hypothetical protein
MKKISYLERKFFKAHSELEKLEAIGRRHEAAPECATASYIHELNK